MTHTSSAIEKHAKKVITVTAACLSTMLYSSTALANCEVPAGAGTPASPANGTTITCDVSGSPQTTSIGGDATDITVDIQDDVAFSGAGSVNITTGTVTLGNNVSLNVATATGRVPIQANNDTINPNITVNLSGDNASIEGATGGSGASPAISASTVGLGITANTTVTLSGDNSSVIGHDAGIEAYSYYDDASATVTLSGDGSSVLSDSGAAIFVYSYDGNASANVTLGTNSSVTSTSTSAIGVSGGAAGSDASSVINNGTITGTTAAINLTTGNDIIRNNADGIITGAINTSGGDDVVTNTGDITGDIDLGAGDDVLNLDLDTGTFVGTADGGSDSTGDVLNVEANDGDATLGGNFINFETVNLTGDNNITTSGTLTSEIINLVGTTDLSVASTAVTTATTGVMGNASGNNVTVASGGVLNADINLGAGADTLTNEGDITGDIIAASGSNIYNFNAGSLTGDVLSSTGTDSINLNGGSFTGNITDSNLASGISSLFLNADTTVSGNISTTNTRLNAGNTLTTSDLDTTNANSVAMATPCSRHITLSKRWKHNTILPPHQQNEFAGYLRNRPRLRRLGINSFTQITESI